MKVREKEQKRRNAEKSVKEIEAVQAAREKEGRLEALRKLTRRRLGVDVSIFGQLCMRLLQILIPAKNVKCYLTTAGNQFSINIFFVWLDKVVLSVFGIIIIFGI